MTRSKHHLLEKLLYDPIQLIVGVPLAVPFGIHLGTQGVSQNTEGIPENYKHGVSTIDKNTPTQKSDVHSTYDVAKRIVEVLRQAGEEAYFAGGWVRDHLLGIPASDIDIATSATTERVSSLFEKVVLLGEAFGVCVVVMDEQSFEVTTFRCDGDYQDGRHPSLVRRGTLQEDAERRDFTVNGLFFDPIDERVIDYVGGKEDLEKRLLRAIGNPSERFAEDRLRILRAVRFKVRYQLQFDPETEGAMQKFPILPHVSIERIVDELRKMNPFLHQAMPWLNPIMKHLIPSFDVELANRVDDAFPLPLKLLAGMRKSDVSEQRSVFGSLKMSGAECSFIDLLERMEQFYEDLVREGNPSPYQAESADEPKGASGGGCHGACRGERIATWVRLWSEPFAEECFFVYCLCRGKEDAAGLRRWQKQWLRRYGEALSFYREKGPVLQGRDLMSFMAPGPAVGHWLKRAFTLSVQEGLFSKEALLRRLKGEEGWPGE